MSFTATPPTNQQLAMAIQDAINGHELLDAISTMITVCVTNLTVLGVCKNREEALVHLAVMITSPAEGGVLGSLIPKLQEAVLIASAEAEA